MFTLLVQLLEGIFNLIFELLSLVFKSFSKKKGYHDDFASESVLLSRWNKGFCLTGRKNISVKDSFMNCLVQGQTGSGKTQCTLLPTILSMKNSFVIHDPAKELFNASAGYLTSQGYDVKIINFSDPSVSSGFNPMSRANTSSEIQKLAAMLVRTSLSGGKEDAFWTSQAQIVLGLCISILKTQRPEYQNLFNVRQLINKIGAQPDHDETNPVDRLFENYADPVLFNEYKSLIALDQKLLSSILSTCKSSLTLLTDESVARVTSSDSFDFMELRKKPTAIFLQSSVADLKYYSVLVSAFFDQLSNFILSRIPADEEQKIFLLIDEFSALRVDSFLMLFPNCRKHKSGIMAVVQSYSQIVNAYGKENAAAIRANCFSQLYFTASSADTAKELEQILGKYEYTDDAGQRRTRELMTASEIRTMPGNRALLIAGNHPAIQVKLRPCYKTRRYRQFCAIKPPILSGECSGALAVLPLETTYHSNG